MVTWNGYNTVVSWQLREDDVSPIFTPLYHAGALGAFLIPCSPSAAPSCSIAASTPSEVWRTIEQERCTVVLGVPTIWKLLMEAPEFQSVDLSHVRWLISGGAPLPEYLIDAYQRRGVVFKQGYGLTEVGVNCFAMTVDDSVRKKGSIGKPLMFTETRLVDEDGREVPVGDVGELWLRGPHVSRGYWNNPQATAAALDAERLVSHGRPGAARCRGIPLHRRTPQGHVHQRRRKRVPGGDRRGAAVARRRAGCCQSSACRTRRGARSVSRSSWRGRDERRPPTPSRSISKARLARYKVPKEFVFVDALPRTPYGKVIKADLVRAYAARGGSAS